MSVLRIALTLSAAVGICSSALAIDHVTSVGEGSVKKTSGNITTISKDVVAVDQRNLITKISTAEIRYIEFESDPATLANAKRSIDDGNYVEGLRSLDLLDASAVANERSRTDFEYLKLLCRAKLALVGGQAIRPVAVDLNRFVAANGDSYHFYNANELLGDLLAADGTYSKAEEFYAKLTESEAYRMRGNVALGWLLLKQSKTTEAQAAFEKVISDRATNPEQVIQQQVASLGKAICLAESDNEQSVRLIEGVISKAPAENHLLMARTYNALGAIHEKAQRNQDAILAYLHVDLLYAQNPDEHAESLGKLAKLFTAVNDAQRAAQTRGKLQKLYPGSKWAK